MLSVFRSPTYTTTLTARSPARAMLPTTFLGRRTLAGSSSSSHLTGGWLLSPGKGLSGPRRQSSVLVEANSKTGLDQTKRGTRRARTRTSGFRARMQTANGRKVLAARRKKGRKVVGKITRMDALLQSPELMKAAMEQMGKMTPEDMQRMQAQIASLPPGFMQEQMARMGNLGPNEVQRATETMRNTTPAAAQQAFNHVAAQAEPTEVRQARALKDAGNMHHAQGHYEQAATSYLQALSHLDGQGSPEASTLRKACSLNLASCHLKTGNWKSCVSECGDVLARFPTDRKALYRRGQALLHLGQAKAAIRDLQDAINQSPNDEKEPIRAKLQEAKEALEKAPLVDGPIVEEVEEVEEMTAQPQSRGPYWGSEGGAGVSAARPLPGLPEPFSGLAGADYRGAGATPGFAEAAAAMQNNPDMMRSAMNMMQSIPPEQLESMMRGMGSMRGMGASSGASAPAPAGLGGSGLSRPTPVAPNDSSASAASPVPNPLQPDPAAMAGLLKDPAMMKSMQDMMKSLRPEDIQSMAKMAGKEISTEEAEQMSQKIGSLSEAQVQRVLQFSSWLQTFIAYIMRLWQMVLANKLLVVGVLVLLVAAVLRYWGWA